MAAFARWPLLALSLASFEILLSTQLIFPSKKTQMADEDTFLFTSESVNEGHPDKLADQVRS
jgi:hypothetical protein